jgi:predicted transposase/invertase (TIGR01784 family)
MAIISNPHDLFFKRSMQEVLVAKDFFLANLPKHILEKINLNTLKLQSGSFVDEHLRSSMADILYQVETAVGLGYIFLLLEHQSTPEKMMPFRRLKYTINVMDKHIRQGHKELPLVYGLVLYHGKQEPYPYSCDIFDLFSDKTMAKEFLFKPFHLIDLTQVSDDQIRKFGLAAIFVLIQKNIFSSEILPAIQLLAKWGTFTAAERAKLVGYIKSMLNYIANYAETNELNTLLQTLEREFSKEEETKEAIVTIREQLERRGERIGIEKGRRETQRQMAMDMLKAGESDIKIRQYTKLSQHEIDQLKKEVA